LPPIVDSSVVGELIGGRVLLAGRSAHGDPHVHGFGFFVRWTRAVQVVVEVHSTEVPDADPNFAVVAVAPRANPAPVIVTVVPPAAGPLLGDTFLTVGAGPDGT
jgi:hypothetical protein